MGLFIFLFWAGSVAVGLLWLRTGASEPEGRMTAVLTAIPVLFILPIMTLAWRSYFLAWKGLRRNRILAVLAMLSVATCYAIGTEAFCIAVFLAVLCINFLEPRPTMDRAPWALAACAGAACAVWVFHGPYDFRFHGGRAGDAGNALYRLGQALLCLTPLFALILFPRKSEGSIPWRKRLVRPASVAAALLALIALEIALRPPVQELLDRRAVRHCMAKIGAREKVAWQLMILGDLGQKAKPAIPAIEPLLNDPDEGIRQSAEFALERIR